MPRKHIKIFAKLRIYKIYYNVTDFQGLHTIRRPLEARFNTKESNRKPERPSFWRKIKWFHFEISAKAIILVQRKHIKIFAKQSIYKIYYNVTDFQGLQTIRRPLKARSNTKESNRKPGKPSFWRKIKWFDFAISAKAIILVPIKKTLRFSRNWVCTNFIKRNKKCRTDFQGLQTIRRPLEVCSCTKEFNKKPGRPSFWRK